MRKSALDHPLWFVELALVPALSALLAIALFSPRDALLVGTLLGLLAGVLLGIGVTLTVTRWAVTQASRTAPAALLGDIIEGEYTEL